MAASTPKIRMKGLLDNWSTREKLALACSVQKNGDQNWLSVSRAIKPYGEPHRPSDWFSHRNCATQYASFLEKVETPKRKSSKDKGELDVPSRQIVTKLTIERTEELKKLLVEHQNKYKKLKREEESILSGQWDDNIKEKWEEALAAKEAEERVKKEAERKQQEEYEARAAAVNQLHGHRRPSHGSQGNLSEMDDNTQDSLADSTIDVSQGDEDSMDAPGPPTLTISTGGMLASSGDVAAFKANPPPSPLLSHLLKSSHKASSDLQRIKQEQEQVKQEQEQLDVSGSGIDNMDIGSVATPASFTSQQSDFDDTAGKEEAQSENTEVQNVDNLSIKLEVKEEASNQESMTSSENSSDTKLVGSGDKTHCGSDLSDTKPDLPADVGIEEEDKSDGDCVTFITVDEEVSVKEEPESPASSIMSNLSETRSARRSRGSASSGRGLGRMVRKRPFEKDDTSSRHSEADNTDDDAVRESDDVLSRQPILIPAAFLESVPNSPASTGISDTEDEKAYKAWKKSIMLVWRTASNHKDASVFLHPVTNDIAPGYHNVVHRPMDMHTIKKNIENGTIRTTGEFQRDMMLMFTNAVMYNASNHNVNRMAQGMYDDVLESLEQYIHTQMMVHSTDHKLLRGSRRNEDKEEKRRSSVDQQQEGGKTKKRKRTDE